MNKATNNTPGLRTAGLLLAVLAAFALSACAITPASEDDLVIKRAQERWDLIIAGELEEAYEYYSPGWRSTHSLIDFGVSQRVRRVAYTSAKYAKHECEESRCKVTFLVGFKVPKPVPGMAEYNSQNNIQDTWIKTGGEWWYLPKK